MSLLNRVIPLLLLLSLLSGCGFHLRGSGGEALLPSNLQQVSIEGDRFSPFIVELRRQLQARGAVLEAGENATRLRIIRQSFRERNLSVGSDGNVREKEIYLLVEFELRDAANKVVAPRQAITLVRDYFNDERQVLGQSTEAGVLREEMTRDAVQRLLERLRKQQ